MLSTIGCGRPYFERLLQLNRNGAIVNIVVEGPILKGYYNFFLYPSTKFSVVEDLVLKGYYNTILIVSP